MAAPIPPPLIVVPPDSPPTVALASDAGGNDVERASAFAVVLEQARVRRGIAADALEVFVPEVALAPPPEPGAGELWVPHLFCWRDRDHPTLAWERCRANQIQLLFDADPADVARWARRPELLLDLLRLAASDVDALAGEGHLSMRWLLANEAVAAERLTRSKIAFEHVSLHVTADEEDAVVAALTEGLGMVEIRRPPSIRTPGRWLQAGQSRLHLNSRRERPDESGFPGTAPNHLCFAVADIDAAEGALQTAGFDTERAGSLGDQVWVRLASGTAIELQPLRSGLA